MDLQDLQDESIIELKSSYTSCPSMFIHCVRKLMHRCLGRIYRETQEFES